MFLAFHFLLLLPALLPAATPADPGEAELARTIEEIISRGEAGKGFWGIEVFAPARGRILYQRNAHKYFSPASVAKLFPTAVALDLEGPAYQFRTLVGARARIDRHGRLLGNLYLVGGGDPDLAGCTVPYVADRDEQECEPTAVLDQLAAQVRENGVRTVEGDLIIDQSFFSPEPYPTGWTVGDLVWGYGAPVRALSLAANTLRITVEPGERPGDPARIAWKPFTRFYKIHSRVWTGSPGSETLLWLRRDPGSRVVEVSGSIALGHPGRTLEVAVEEPSDYVGELFRRALERRGVRVQGELDVDYAPAPPFAAQPGRVLPVILAEHKSRPLVEQVTLINKESHNLHAEMLLRLLGRRRPPPTPVKEPVPKSPAEAADTERLPFHHPRRPYEPPPRRADGSTEAGLEVLRAWLANAGVNPYDVELYDGSGLSRRNLVTPHAVVRLLRAAEHEPWGELFRDSLPVAGVDGTLADRMKNSPARGRLRAKTGTLGHTNALAGAVETASGERLLFALFLNHHTLEDEEAVKLLDEIAAALVALPPAGKQAK